MDAWASHFPQVLHFLRGNIEQNHISKLSNVFLYDFLFLILFQSGIELHVQTTKPLQHSSQSLSSRRLLKTLWKK